MIWDQNGRTTGIAGRQGHSNGQTTLTCLNFVSRYLLKLSLYLIAGWFQINLFEFMHIY